MKIAWKKLLIQPITNFCYSFFLLILIMQAVSCNTKDNREGQESKSQEPTSSFKSSEPVLDVDGQIYQTITIGSQTWMAEDLKKTEIECDSNHNIQFTNGLERGPGVKLYVDAPRYAWYKNNKDLGFGVIYNFSVLQHCQLCPPGYRIPTNKDWETLIENIGGKSVAPKSLTQEGNKSFMAKLGGRIDSYGSVLAGSYGFWWCSDILDSYNAYTFEIGSRNFVQLVAQPKRTGVYVRCIKKHKTSF